jgi:hypothetical protein
MPSGYVVGRAAAGTNLTIALVAGIATARPSVHQLIVSSDATPADIATKFQLLRHTAAAAGGTALVVKAADPGATSMLCTALQGTMTEPTYETNGELEFAVNQRATYTWIANPGREIKTAVGTANGLGLRSIASGGTPNINTTIAWDE